MRCKPRYNGNGHALDKTGSRESPDPRGPVLTRLTRLGMLARPGLARCSRSSDTPAQYTLPDQGHRSGWLLNQYMTYASAETSSHQLSPTPDRALSAGLSTPSEPCTGTVEQSGY
ncbi:hypothetical protein J6590_090154 [Homalodisca vitripennis]|nr:hypothetical protein J6590_090154 [Homalodisca vitripennis]